MPRNTGASVPRTVKYNTLIMFQRTNPFKQRQTIQQVRAEHEIILSVCKRWIDDLLKTNAELTKNNSELTKNNAELVKTNNQLAEKLINQ